jgi:hypothetical protein
MDTQVITIVEGNVPEKAWQNLQSGYAAILGSVPRGILQSFIIQDRNDPTLWRLITIWKNLEMLKAMQQENAVPPGIKIFKEVGVEPTVKIFDVKSSFSEN